MARVCRTSLLTNRNAPFISFWMDFKFLKAYSYRSAMTLEREALLRHGREMKNSLAMYTQFFFPGHPQVSCSHVHRDYLF